MIESSIFDSIRKKLKADLGYINFIEALEFEADKCVYMKIWTMPDESTGIVLAYKRS